MAIVYPLTFPAHKGPSSINIRQRKVVGVNTSPGSLVAQVYEWPGERWEAEFTLPPMQRENAEAWIAWLISLRGPVGSFLMGDPSSRYPLGQARYESGTPQVNGNHAAQVRTLAIKTGLTRALGGWLKAGSWLSLGTAASRRLHKVLTDVDLDVDGTATLDIWPALRTTVADNAPVDLFDTTGRFMLTGQSIEYVIDNARHFRPAVVGCVENLRP